MKKYLFIGGLLIIAAGAFTDAVIATSEPSRRLFIISPTPGEVIAGNDVKVIVQLPAWITLVDPDTRAENGPGEGHLHLWLDALPAHDNAVSVVPLQYPEYVYTNVFSGLHTLHVELFQNDHRPYESLIAAGVEFETVGEELKPVSNQEGQTEAPPESDSGMFIPRGKSNTVLVIILIVVAMAILWYMFGRPPKRKT